MLFHLNDDPHSTYTYLTPTLYASAPPCPYPSVANPAIYLDFAETDIAEGGERGLTNAIGNVKRALHLRIDMLLNQYAAFVHYGDRIFPAKLALLQELGLLPTTLIRNLNAERNVVEHEYVIPAPARAAEALDTAHLLYLATERHLERSVVEVVLGRRGTSQHVVMRIEPTAAEYRFFSLETGGNVRTGDDGIQTISKSLHLLGTDLTDGYRISERPESILKVNEANKGEWLPITKMLIVGTRSMLLNSARRLTGGEIATSVIFPISWLDEKGWAQAVLEAVAHHDN